MDWSIHYRDFPRNRVSAHYEVWAIRFFVCAKGIGRSPMEAAKRAVRVLDVRSARFHRENCATDEDMSRI